MSAKRFLWLLFIFSAFSSPGICSEQEEGIDCSFGLFQKGKNREIVDINKALWLKARKDADDVLMMDAALSVGMAYVALNQPDSARQWLEDAVQWAEALDSPWVTARANQAFGVSAMVDYLDFDGAYGYLFKALEAAEDAEDKSMRYGIMIDIAMAGIYRQDTSAMKYARAIYEMGVSSGSDFFKYTGSIMMAHFLYLKKDYEQALRMIGDAADLADSFYNHTEVYTLYGNILSALGHDGEAAGCFRVAQEYADDTELPVKIYFYLDYGSFLLKTRRANEALAVLNEGLEIAEGRHVEVFTYLFYKSISDSYAQLRDTGKALEYYKIFHEKSDSVFNVESVRTINELQKKYQNEVLERELRDKELVLERERRQYYALRQASGKQEPQSTVESPSKPSEQRLFEKLCGRFGIRQPYDILFLFPENHGSPSGQVPGKLEET